MTAVWTPPLTFIYAQRMDSALFNTYLRDNMEWLHDRPSSTVGISGSTTSATFAAATGSISHVCYGGNLLISLVCSVTNTSAGVLVGFDFAIDGTRLGDPTNGRLLMHTHSTANSRYPLTLEFITTTPPAAGTRTIEVYRKTASGTLSSDGDLYVMEVG